MNKESVAAKERQYIYVLLNDNDERIYVGKTKIPKVRERQHRHRFGSDLGLNVRMLIIEETNRDNVDKREIWWIKYGREIGWPLINKQRGGLGGNPYHNDPEWRKRYSLQTKANWQNPEVRKKYFATVHDPEYRKRKSEQQKEIWADPELLKAHAARMKIINNDPRRRKKLSISIAKWWSNPDTVKKMRKACLRGWENPERRKAVSEQNRKRWQKDHRYRKTMKKVVALSNQRRGMNCIDHEGNKHESKRAAVRAIGHAWNWIERRGGYVIEDEQRDIGTTSVAVCVK